ncbi:hypothetical protein KY290_031299 [Solanum tuberosum]|uniref:Uncharacterized protein n=1 Tax=Solanum tuberosum TaxID=4113 RepID=A0ABQ7U8Q9_SOLTU|nr:hypothetical protein KY290_031299 [Solanum tuberosum]
MSKPESTHNGMPVVIFKSSDYYGVMVEECRYTIIGKSIEIDGTVMWLQKWTPDYKPDEDSPIVPATLYISILLLIFDRPGMERVRIEVDLMTKPKLRSVWVRQEDTDNLLKGFCQSWNMRASPSFVNFWGIQPFNVQHWRGKKS